MNCDEARILLHALIDGELDASHAREVEAHIATCPACGAELAAYRELHEKIASADLRVARICVGIGGVGDGGDRSCCHRAA